MKRQPTQWLAQMWLEGRVIVEIIHDQLTQIIGRWLRIQMAEQLSESFDMSTITAVDDMPPNLTWDELYLAASDEARTICTQCIFSIIDIDKYIREPAWVESSRQVLAGGTPQERPSTHQTSTNATD